MRYLVLHEWSDTCILLFYFQHNCEAGSLSAHKSMIGGLVCACNIAQNYSECLVHRNFGGKRPASYRHSTHPFLQRHSFPLSYFQLPSAPFHLYFGDICPSLIQPRGQCKTYSIAAGPNLEGVWLKPKRRTKRSMC